MKKNKTISLLVFSILLLGIASGCLNVRAQPQMGITSCPSSIEPNEHIYITVEFEYENSFQAVINLVLSYEINSGSSHDIEQSLDTNRPSEKVISFETNDLDLVDGDVLRISVSCEWGSWGFVKGTLEDTATVNVSVDKTSFGLVFGIIALISTSVVAIVWRKKKR